MSRCFEKDVLFRTTPERLWRALTTSTELVAWIGPGASIDPRPGGRLELGPPGGGEILTIEPPRRLVVRWDVFGPDQPVTGTLTLEPTPEGTRLIIVEEGFHDGESGLWAMGGSAAGWDDWIANLQGWIGSGKRAVFGVSGSIGASFGLRRLTGLGEGVYIRSVKPGSAAEKAGLQPGDDLVAWNGKPVGNSADFYRHYWATRPGEQVTLTVERGGQRLTFTPVLG